MSEPRNPDDEPVACTLSSEHLRCNAHTLIPGLVARSRQCGWSHEGLTLEFAPESAHLRAITDTIDRERDCCRFLTFTLTVPGSRRPFTLSITGPSGSRAFLEQLLAPAVVATP